ncbi:MAG: hypothetical protein HY645_08790 [Acidobacteria bacterium]|nr:hypothetical protein [Acidobacteriota bacterium]
MKIRLYSFRLFAAVLLLLVTPIQLQGQNDPEARNTRPNSLQLVIFGAEVNFNPAPNLCGNPRCGGILLISGTNFGSMRPFGGTVELYVPRRGKILLPVLDFDPVNQQLLAELPENIEGTPGSFMLTVSTGQATTQFDATPEPPVDRFHHGIVV